MLPFWSKILNVSGVGVGVGVGVLVGVGVGVGVGAQSTNIDLAKTFDGLFLSLIETQYVAVILGIGTPVVANVVELES